MCDVLTQVLYKAGGYLSFPMIYKSCLLAPLQESLLTSLYYDFIGVRSL